MTKLRILMMVLLLALAGARVDAALFGGGEKKAFDSAYQSFRAGIWERAEEELTDFLKDYPKAEQATQAALWLGEALYQQKKFDVVIEQLQSRVATAGSMEDQFLYWIGSAQAAQTNYAAAAATFGKLAREFRTSGRRLEASVGEAAAFFKQSEWAQVTNLLRRADGAFRQAGLAVTNNETVARGYLLLAEAQLALGNIPDAEAALTNKKTQVLTGELEWKRRDLLCRTLLAKKDVAAAAEESAGLVTAAQSTGRIALVADSVVFRADLLEQLGQRDEAITNLQRNLVNAPVARQREALTRIVALQIQQGQVNAATQTLESYLGRNTNAPAADVAWLTLGELYLKQHVGKLRAGDASAAGMNLLSLATNCFDRVLKSSPGSSYAGKAQLNLGWCYWVENNWVASEAAFTAAAKQLPLSEDLVVARFKLADAQFQQANFAAASENYRIVLQQATNWLSVNAVLRTPASYQALRASLAQTNQSGASNLTQAEEAMWGILSADAERPEAVNSLLLVTQAYADAKQSAEVQRLFQEFITRYPKSELRPEVELLMSRMQEEQGDWSKVVQRYEAWLESFPTNRLRPQVEFQRALATARSGAETNALGLFTNFVSRFAGNDLAPRAQWWVADYYFGRGAFAAAEIQYKQLFQTWKDSELAYPAKLMAGRAAYQWSSYPNAIEHFTGLATDTNCPVELRVQAYFAYGGVLMRSLPATTNKFAQLEQARLVFGLIVQEYPTSPLVAEAWGEIGNCALQLAVSDVENYVVASNAYHRAASTTGANVATRSRAWLGLASVLEKQAARQTDTNGATSLLQQARGFALDVFWDKHLTPEETADVYWKKRAGLEAARLSGVLGEWSQALGLYRDFARLKLLPADQLEKLIVNAEKQARPEEKIN